MARTWEVPGYVVLAQRANARLGGTSEAGVRAILAQWQCEQPDPAPWPPVHDNPGNLTRNIGSLGGPPPPTATTAPGAGLLYQYATPEAGADAYATYLLRSSRYPAAVAAIRRGDEVGFLTAVCNGGYGTRLSCCLSLLAEVVYPTPATTARRFVCTAGPVRVRTTPSLSGSIVGLVGVGSVIAGTLVTGGRYVVGTQSSTLWVAMGPDRYTAALCFRATS